MKKLEDVLDDCLNRVLAGESVDTVVAAYPGQAPELEPLLRVVLSVKEAAGVRPRAEFRAAARGRVRQALSTHELKPRPHWPRLAWRPAWAPLVACLLVLAVVGTTVAYLGRSPGDMRLAATPTPSLTQTVAGVLTPVETFAPEPESAVATDTPAPGPALTSTPVPTLTREPSAPAVTTSETVEPTPAATAPPSTPAPTAEPTATRTPVVTPTATPATPAPTLEPPPPSTTTPTATPAPESTPAPASTTGPTPSPPSDVVPAFMPVLFPASPALAVSMDFAAEAVTRERAVGKIVIESRDIRPIRVESVKATLIWMEEDTLKRRISSQSAEVELESELRPGITVPPGRSEFEYGFDFQVTGRVSELGASIDIRLGAQNDVITLTDSSPFVAFGQELWNLPISASASASSAAIDALVHPRSSQAYDVRDGLMPPLAAGARQLALYFPHLDWPQRAGKYMSEAKPPPTPEHPVAVWDFEAVTLGYAAQVTLSWDLAQVPAKYQAILLTDLTTGTTINLRAAGRYTYSSLSDEVRQFRLRVALSSEV